MTLSFFNTLPSAGSVQRLARRCNAGDCYAFFCHNTLHTPQSHPWLHAILTAKDDPLKAACDATALETLEDEKYPQRFGQNLTEFLTELAHIQPVPEMDLDFHKALKEAIELSTLLPLEAGLYAEQTMAMQQYETRGFRGKIALKRAEMVSNAAAQNFKKHTSFCVGFRGHGALRTTLENRSSSAKITILGPDDDADKADLWVVCADEPLSHNPQQKPVLQFVSAIQPAWSALTKADQRRTIQAEWVKNKHNPEVAVLSVVSEDISQDAHAAIYAFFQRINVTPMTIHEGALDISATLAGAMVSGYAYWLERGVSLTRIDAACHEVGFAYEFSQALNALGAASAAQVQRDFGEEPSPLFENLFRENLQFSDLYENVPAHLCPRPIAGHVRADDIVVEILAPLLLVADQYLDRGAIARLSDFDILVVNILGMSRSAGGLSHLMSETGLARITRAIELRTQTAKAPWYRPAILDYLIQNSLGFDDIALRPWPKQHFKRLKKSPPPLRLDQELRALTPQD